VDTSPITFDLSAAQGALCRKPSGDFDECVTCFIEDEARWVRRTDV
jgi:hypothetical protein